MLQEGPDAAKLRKKVIDQQVEMASMRRVMKAITKSAISIKAACGSNTGKPTGC
jgi:hypothetical protein